MGIKQSFIAASLLSSLSVATPVARAVEASPEKMPPQARDAFDKGLSAVEQKEWIVAADSFQKAWKINTKSSSSGEVESEIVFNWGLAEAQIPGRELRAIVCFNLYLYVADKDAANAGAVRKEKALLEVRQEARLRQLLTQAKKFVAELDGDDEMRRHVAAGGYDLSGSLSALRRQAYRRVARVQAMAGDLVGAVQTADLCREELPGDPQVTSEILDFGEYKGIQKNPIKDIEDLQTEAEKPPRFGVGTAPHILRDLLISDDFNKIALTDPTSALQALADKKKPQDLFEGYMQVIENVVFVLQRATGQRIYFNSARINADPHQRSTASE